MFLVTLLQQMAWQYSNAGEQPFGSRIRSCEIEPHRIRIQLRQLNRLAGYDEEFTLRRVHTLILVNTKSKDYVVGVKWVTVGELQSLPEFNRELPSIRGLCPPLCQSSNRLEGFLVDIDQAPRDQRDHLSRAYIQGSNWI